MKKFLLVWLAFFQLASASAETNRAWEDFKETFLDAFRAFPYQFQTKSNAVIAGIAAPSLWYSFEEDDRISRLARGKEESTLANIAGDMSIAAHFPILPFGFYALGRSNHNEKLIKFSKELFVATYMADWETVVLSFIPINTRPNDDVSFWEASFRGNSSFPSGHIVPFTALTMKTLQFYGPLRALVPAALMILTGYQRVQEGKHYLSDVVGGIFLGIFASEGSRLYANNKNNHPFYKMIFEHEVRVSLLPFSSGTGMQLTWNY